MIKEELRNIFLSQDDEVISLYVAMRDNTRDYGNGNIVVMCPCCKLRVPVAGFEDIHLAMLHHAQKCLDGSLVNEYFTIKGTLTSSGVVYEKPKRKRKPKGLMVWSGILKDAWYWLGGYK